MRHFPAAFEILGELEEAVTFVPCFLRRQELLLSGSDGEIVLDDGHDQTARGDFCPRARDGSGGRGTSKTRYACEVQSFMHVALADVFVDGIVGDVTHAVARAVALRVKRFVVVAHAGE